MSSFFQELKRRNALRVGLACGPDGFAVWRPSDSECGCSVTPAVPN